MFRDVNVDIRALCIYQFGILINKNKFFCKFMFNFVYRRDFFNIEYLNYVGTCLFDKVYILFLCIFDFIRPLK